MVIAAICMGNQCFISAPVCLFLIKRAQSLSVTGAVWMEYLNAVRTQRRVACRRESRDGPSRHHSCQENEKGKNEKKTRNLYPASAAEHCHVCPIPNSWLNHVKCLPGGGSRWSASRRTDGRNRVPARVASHFQ